jgi:branched-chain amino acid transport system substrate-binding protein
MPTMVHAGDYSAVRHYLRAVETAQTDDAPAVMARMRELPVTDAYTPNGVLREDGQMLHDMYLVEVKSESESKGPWDYYKVLQTIPANSVFKTLAESDCPLLRK